MKKVKRFSEAIAGNYAYGVKLEPQHTPTPWEINGNRITYWDIKNNKNSEHVACKPKEMDLQQWRKNTAFIVRAVNCHEELLECAKIYHDEACSKSHPEECDLCELIAKAEGKE